MTCQKNEQVPPDPDVLMMRPSPVPCGSMLSQSSDACRDEFPGCA